MASARDVYGRIVNPAGKYGDPLGINKPPATADTDRLRVLGIEGAARQKQIENERNATTLDKTDQNQSATQQQQAIVGLQQAATGAAPSAAENQIRQQGQIDAARQIALAKAIGAHSAGGGAYRAAVAGANTAGNAAINAAATRANEMATAQSQLADALAASRGQDINAYKNDVDERNTLLAAQLAQQGTSQGIAGANVAAQQTAAGYQNQLDAAKIGAVGSGVGTYLGQRQAGATSSNPYADVGDGTGRETYAPVGDEPVLSDYRAKKNIRMADEIRRRAR